MRIVSPFHDYYDSTLAYGFDTSRTYVRKSVVFEGERARRYKPEKGSVRLLPPHLIALSDWAALCADVDASSTLSRHNPDPNGRRFRSTPLTFTVGARAIKALWLEVTEPLVFSDLDCTETEHHALTNRPPNANHSLPPPCGPVAVNRKIVYQGPVFEQGSLALWLGPWIERETDKKKHSRNKVWRSWNFLGAQHTGLLGQIDWLTEENTPANLHALMTAAACPVAVANAAALAIENPCLADFQLYRRLDPSSCMQEIAMFVSNLANPERPTETLDDRYKIVGHGFNEASFRKQPTKSADPKSPKRPHPDKRIA